jgi:glycosyltransferase involved in cell wall biosynthesis
VLLSVIIPTRNRAQRLADLLDSLAAQEPVPFEWEVIVVDNASTDATAEVARQKSENLPITIRYVLEPRLGLHHGRHRGAKEAQGTFLGYLDDDTIVAPSWVQGVRLLVQGQADAVVGRILPQWEAEPPGWLQAMIQARGGVFDYLTLLDLGTVAKPVDPAYVWGANFFLPRQLVFDLGGFHPDAVPSDLLHYRGDGESALMWKFKQAGLRSYYDPMATVFHVIGADRLTLEYICQRAYNQGISASFTQIRAARGLPGSPLPNSSNESRSERLNSHWKSLKSLYGKLRRKSIADVARIVGTRTKRTVARTISKPRKGPYAEIQAKIDKAFRAGWQFHQNEVKTDPGLLEYVLRQTYLE